MDKLVLDLVAVPLLQVDKRRQGRLLQFAAVVVFQRATIRDNPRFHTGHKQYLIFGCAFGSVPIRNCLHILEVFPAALMSAIGSSLSIHIAT